VHLARRRFLVCPQGGQALAFTPGGRFVACSGVLGRGGGTLGFRLGPAGLAIAASERNGNPGSSDQQNDAATQGETILKT
jgi:hypothetical protein